MESRSELLNISVVCEVSKYKRFSYLYFEVGKVLWAHVSNWKPTVTNFIGSNLGDYSH